MIGSDLQTAVSMDPENVPLRFRYALSLLESKDLAEAEEQARWLVARVPKDIQAINVLGVILKQQKRYAEALHEFNKAAKRQPSHISAWVNLGNICMILEEYSKAVDNYSRAVRLTPKDAENRKLLAGAYTRLGSFEKAREHLDKALALNPKDPRILLELAVLHFKGGEPVKALEEIDRALALAPHDASLLRPKAVILRKLKRADEALALYDDLLRRDPEDSETLAGLASFHFDGGDRQMANQYYERALQADPNNRAAAAQYCECLLNSRYGNEAEHIEKAYGIARQLVKHGISNIAVADAVQGVFLRMADYESYALLGDRQRLIQHWLIQMKVGELHNQLGRVVTMQERLDLVEAHKVWGRKSEDLVKRHPPIQRTPRVVRREKIRVGLMSSDLRHHPVTYFVQPIIQHYDRSRFEIYGYSFYPNAPDATQQWISATVDQFRVLPTLTDRDVAQKIADDQLDILFELGGTTHLNRLMVTAYRPAPVQVSWLGYPHSTGLSTIDYILVDPYLKPTDQRLLIERPFIMPESWVSLGEMGFYDIPVEPKLPEERVGGITFGTMNNPYKYSPELIATWAEVLRRVDGSRFLFVRPEAGTPSFRRNICREFAKHGVNAKRIFFAAVRAKHMPFYNQMDISLDTFPHVGGTTTCETLWMGVPVVSLVGPAFFERLSYSNLANAGLADLCVTTKDDYLRVAVALAANRDRRRALRTGLRAQIRNHPLGQTERFVRNFEKTIEQTLTRK